MTEELEIQFDQQELFEHRRFIADKGQQLIRIDKFLTNHIENVSRTRIQMAADAGNILVNESAVKPNYRIKPGDVITIVLSFPPVEHDIIPENIPLDIIYEDEDLLVVNKPAGMVVHPAHGNWSGTLVNALMYHINKLPVSAGNEIRPGLVHRIDKDTSGILVVAKNELSLNKLARQFFEKTTERVYYALVWGSFTEETGTITGNIGRSLKDRKKMAVFPDGSQGKHSVTHYRVKENLGYVTLVECVLETGRTHQIRAHFEYLKHPLFNDDVYGGAKIVKGNHSGSYKQFIANCFSVIPRQALHAALLAFDHPKSGKRLTFESKIPEDMSLAIDKWRKFCSLGKNDVPRGTGLA